jgi:hypothetical protein
MLHAAPLSAPEDVAWFLASYARAAKTRIEGLELSALGSVRTALEEALGLKFEGEKGDHFFRSSLVQTLFYGVFSAWVLWFKQHRRTRNDRFDWRSAAWYLRVPMISKLRVAVYLTNALTGWEPPKGPKQHLMFKELEDERDAAARKTTDQNSRGPRESALQRLRGRGGG